MIEDSLDTQTAAETQTGFFRLLRSTTVRCDWTVSAFPQSCFSVLALGRLSIKAGPGSAGLRNTTENHQHERMRLGLSHAENRQLVSDYIRRSQMLRSLGCRGRDAYQRLLHDTGNTGIQQKHLAAIKNICASNRCEHSVKIKPTVGK